MAIIDAQVHAYEHDHPGRPWVGTLTGPKSVNGDGMVGAMDAVGVNGALLVSPFSMYRYDASYAIAVQKAHPGRFGLIKPVDPTDPAVVETIADWKATAGTVGVRIMMRDPMSKDPADPGINRVLAAGAKHGLPINILAWGRMEQAAQLAARNPQHPDRDRPSRPATAPQAARARELLGCAASGAGIGGAAEHRDQDHWRLHAVARAIPLQ